MKSKETSTLTPRQLQVLPHLLTSPSYEEAARRSGICSKQIHAWLKLSDFQEELKKQRTAIFSNAIGNLKASSQKAVQTLISLLDDGDPRIRLLASEKLLSITFKGMELCELEERMCVLEESTKKASQQQSQGYQR